jgi:hypothetical protein
MAVGKQPLTMESGGESINQSGWPAVLEAREVLLVW